MILFKSAAFDQPPVMAANPAVEDHSAGVHLKGSITTESNKVGLVKPSRTRSFFPETWLWMETKTGYIIVVDDRLNMHGMLAHISCILWSVCVCVTIQYNLYA